MFQLKKFLPYYKYLKPVWWRFMLGILFGVLFSVSSGLGLPIMAETVFPILFGNSEEAPEWLSSIAVKWFGNNVSGGFLILCSAAIPFVMGIRAISSVGNGYFMSYTGIYVVQSLQIDVYKKVQSMAMAFFQRRKAGELINGIMAYPERIKVVVVDMSNDLVKQPLTLLAAVGYLCYKSVASDSFFIAVVGVLSIPLLVYPVRRIGIYIAKRSAQLVREGEELSSTIIESVQSPLEIRAYNLQQSQTRRFVERLRDIFRLSMKSTRSSLLISPSIEFISACGIGLALYFGVKSGMGQGDFIALIIALHMAYTPIKKLGQIHGRLKQLQAPLSRLEALLGEVDTVPQAVNPKSLPKPVRGEIEFRNVEFNYAPGKPVLHDVSVKIAPGETVALVGKSGAGKSSFVNLIPRFYDPVSGSVCLDGIDIREMNIQELRSQIGYVPQMPMLFNASVADNIRVGKEGATEQEVFQAAKDANALEFIESMKGGFNTVLSERGNSLSGGQRQRIAIARAFLKDAPILILDEATSALDNESDRLIQEALKRLAAQRTTIIIAHRMATLQGVGRRLFFQNGRLVADGEHEGLMKSSASYRMLADTDALGETTI